LIDGEKMGMDLFFKFQIEIEKKSTLWNIKKFKSNPMSKCKNPSV
jgi:hypothetical protein